MPPAAEVPFGIHSIRNTAPRRWSPEKGHQRGNRKPAGSPQEVLPVVNQAMERMT